MENRNPIGGYMKNKLYCGDNLEILQKIDKESIDLIYIDPPFFSNRKYEIVWGDSDEIRSFEDRWEGGIENYIAWMKPRIQAMYNVLKLTGSFYLHCDWHANAHLRILMDSIFGSKNFQNEIAWCYGGGGASTKRFARKHNMILFYTKSKNYTFNTPFVPYKPHSPFHSKGEPYRKEGKVMEDYWLIPQLGSKAEGKLGYPTQKPPKLLGIIIKASSNIEDIVLDAFCGCGTSLIEAHKLGRKWIGIDISPTAINVIKRDALTPMGVIENEHYEIIGAPLTIKELKSLKPFEFQNWVINTLGARHSKTKSNDKGLDGYFPYGLLSKEAGIQVKQSEGIGRNVIDNFKSALERANYKQGQIIAFSFTKGAIEEVARLKNKNETIITLTTVKELIEKKEER